MWRTARLLVRAPLGGYDIERPDHMLRRVACVGCGRVVARLTLRHSPVWLFCSPPPRLSRSHPLAFIQQAATADNRSSLDTQASFQTTLWSSLYLTSLASCTSRAIRSGSPAMAGPCLSTRWSAKETMERQLRAIYLVRAARYVIL